MLFDGAFNFLVNKQIPRKCSEPPAVAFAHLFLEQLQHIEAKHLIPSPATVLHKCDKVLQFKPVIVAGIITIALIFHPLQIRIDDLLQATSQRQADIGQAVVLTPPLQPLLRWK